MISVSCPINPTVPFHVLFPDAACRIRIYRYRLLHNQQVTGFLSAAAVTSQPYTVLRFIQI